MNADDDFEDGAMPGRGMKGLRQADAHLEHGWSEHSLEALKRDVERGYRRFWEKRGMKPPDEGFKSKAMRDAAEARARYEKDDEL